MQRLLVALVLAGCGDHYGGSTYKLSYEWDGKRVVCSQPIDDYQTPESWDRIDADLQLAHDEGWVALFHAHVPGETIARATLDRVLATAQRDGLDFLTYRDIDDPTRSPSAGLALAFDDDAVDAWVTMRDELASYGAHVTFFVTRWQDMTPPQHAELAELAADGHDLEPHTVDHLHAPAYVAANGLDAYLQDEVLPSFQVLTDAGFPPAKAFAYPFGEHTPAIDAAVLQYVDRVRTTPGPCPH